MSDNNSQIIFDSVEQMECPSCHTQVDVHAIPAFSNAICPNCHATLSVPGRLGTFLLLSCLGSGGMGSVYRAFDQTLARIVAIKVMLKSLGDQPEFVASFQREAQAAAKLNHPNIAQIYSFGQEKGQPYIVMELVPGKHFDEMIAEPEFLDQALVMKIGMDIADGLQLAAASNLIHGDIKPENILLDDRGVAKLVDFGIASAPSKGTGEIWGTPYYIAPEKLRRQRVDYRSDIYCLGGTLYHALTRHPPFDGEDAMAVVKARLEGPPAPMATYRPDISPEISEIIDRMLQLEPAMRYPTYGSLLSDMRRYLEHAQPQNTAPVIGGSKRIVIKGRGRGKTSQPLSAGPASTPSNSTGRHPLVISRGMVDPQQSQQLTANLTGLNPAHPEEKKEEAKPKSTASKIAIGCGIAAGVFILLLVLGGLGVFFHIKKKISARADQWVQLQKNGEARLAAIVRSGETLGQMRDTVFNAYSAQSGNIVSQALASVEAELGADDAMRGRILREVLPEPPPELPTDDMGSIDLPSEGAATNAPSADGLAGTAGDSTNVVETAAEDVQPTVSGDASSSPEDGDGTAVEPQAADAGAEPVAETEPVVEEEPLEGLPLLAREVFLALQPVRDANRHVTESIEKVEGYKTEAEAAVAGQKTISIDFTDKDSFEESAVERDGVLQGLAEKQALAESEVALLKDEAETLPAAVKAAQQKLNELLAETAKLEKERAKAAAEEAARLEAEREAAAKAAAEEAARQQEQNELAQLTIKVSEIMDSVKAHRYSDAIRALGEIRDLKTDGAKRQLEILKRRAKAMEDLHRFLIEKISEQPVEITFKLNGATFHWLISEATRRNLTVSNSGGDPVRVPWAKIGPAQMVPLIRHYLQTPANARKLKLIQRTEQQLNAAIYYVIFGAGNESAMKMAKALADKIVTDRPTMKDDVEMLLPELFEEAEPAGGEADGETTDFGE